jgi:hypothetical protein
MLSVAMVAPQREAGFEHAAGTVRFLVEDGH